MAAQPSDSGCTVVEDAPPLLSAPPNFGAEWSDELRAALGHMRLALRVPVGKRPRPSTLHQAGAALAGVVAAGAPAGAAIALLDAFRVADAQRKGVWGESADIDDGIGTCRISHVDTTQAAGDDHEQQFGDGGGEGLGDGSGAEGKEPLHHRDHEATRHHVGGNDVDFPGVPLATPLRAMLAGVIASAIDPVPVVLAAAGAAQAYPLVDLPLVFMALGDAVDAGLTGVPAGQRGRFTVGQQLAAVHVAAGALSLRAITALLAAVGVPAEPMLQVAAASESPAGQHDVVACLSLLPPPHDELGVHRVTLSSLVRVCTHSGAPADSVDGAAGAAAPQSPTVHVTPAFYAHAALRMLRNRFLKDAVAALSVHDSVMQEFTPHLAEACAALVAANRVVAATFLVGGHASRQAALLHALIGARKAKIAAKLMQQWRIPSAAFPQVRRSMVEAAAIAFLRGGGGCADLVAGYYAGDADFSAAVDAYIAARAADGRSTEAQVAAFRAALSAAVGQLRARSAAAAAASNVAGTRASVDGDVGAGNEDDGVATLSALAVAAAGLFRSQGWGGGRGWGKVAPAGSGVPPLGSAHCAAAPAAVGVDDACEGAGSSDGIQAAAGPGTLAVLPAPAPVAYLRLAPGVRLVDVASAAAVEAAALHVQTAARAVLRACASTGVLDDSASCSPVMLEPPVRAGTTATIKGRSPISGSGGTPPPGGAASNAQPHASLLGAGAGSPLATVQGGAVRAEWSSTSSGAGAGAPLPVIRGHALLGLDCEWRSPLTAADTPRCALLQVSCGDTVFLVDLPAIDAEVAAAAAASTAAAAAAAARVDAAFRALVCPAGAGPSTGPVPVLVLTFGGITDFHMIHKSYPYISCFAPLLHDTSGGSTGRASPRVKPRTKRGQGRGPASPVHPSPAVAQAGMGAQVRPHAGHDVTEPHGRGAHRGETTAIRSVDLIPLARARRLPALPGHNGGGGAAASPAAVVPVPACTAAPSTSTQVDAPAASNSADAAEAAPVPVPAQSDAAPVGEVENLSRAAKFKAARAAKKAAAAAAAAGAAGGNNVAAPTPGPGLGSSTGLSLSSLCERLLGAGLDKFWQMSNWERRPLLGPQRAYAAADAWVLPRLLRELLALPDR
jgi:hypothetical protein